MATTVNARDLALAATSPRITPIALPANVSADFSQVTGATKPANNATVNRVTRAATAPVSPIDGDIWIDTSVTPNVVKTRVASAWVSAANYTTSTSELTDGANLGGTAAWTGVTGAGKAADNATVNRITRAATAPASPIDGDIWVDTSATPNIIRTRVAGGWQASASYTTNTTHLTDGANLGGTAAWTGVTGATKPADNATVNRITRAATAPVSPTPVDGDIWIDTSVTPNTVKTRIGGAWVSSATLVTDTANITDGAQLGLTAAWSGVTGAGKPSSYADVTTTILNSSGTSIVMTNANLFKSAAGAAGVFIGSAGIFGKNSGGGTTFSIDGATGAASFSGALSAATGTFSGNVSAENIIGTRINLPGNVSLGKSMAEPTLSLDAGSGEAASVPSAFIRKTNGIGMTTAAVQIVSATLGISAYTTSASALAAHFSNAASGKVLQIASGAYSVYSGSGEGKHYAVDGLGPFTGFHDALYPIGGPAWVPGDIMVDTGIAHKQDISNTLTRVALSSAPGQRTAIGIVSDSRALDGFLALPYALWWEMALTHTLLAVNGVGEGQVNVCAEGGNLQPGDLIVTSSLPGKGMRQPDDLVRSSTVAKCREAVTFDGPGDVRQVACIYLCG